MLISHFFTQETLVCAIGTTEELCKYLMIASLQNNFA